MARYYIFMSTLKTFIIPVLLLFLLGACSKSSPSGGAADNNDTDNEDTMTPSTFFRLPIDGSFTDFVIFDSFGPRILGSRYDFHRAIDISLPIGTKVYAVADGTVIEAGNTDSGITIEIEHDPGKGEGQG